MSLTDGVNLMDGVRLAWMSLGEGTSMCAPEMVAPAEKPGRRVQR